MMDLICTTCRMDSAGQHETHCPLYEGVTVVALPQRNRPTLWLQPCYACKEKDAELAQKDATIAGLANILDRRVEALSKRTDRDSVVARRAIKEALAEARALLAPAPPTEEAPIPMVLHCPNCGEQHVDRPEPERNWTNPPHRSHLCYRCGAVWRPADVATVGVRSIGSRGTGDTWPSVAPAPQETIMCERACWQHCPPEAE